MQYFVTTEGQKRSRTTRRRRFGAANSATGQFGAGPTRCGRFGAGTFRRGVCNADVNFQCNFVCISPVMLQRLVTCLAVEVCTGYLSAVSQLYLTSPVFSAKWITFVRNVIRKNSAMKDFLYIFSTRNRLMEVDCAKLCKLRHHGLFAWTRPQFRDELSRLDYSSLHLGHLQQQIYGLCNFSVLWY